MLHYGTHAFAGKEVDFIYHEIAEQVQADHAAVFPLSTVCGLPKLCLSPVAGIPQVGRLLRLIFDLTWSGLNKATARKALKEVMHFGGTLHRIIRRVLTTKPRLGPVYLGKLDLANDYIRIWFRIEDTVSVVLLHPKKSPEDEQLVGFHLSLPMGFFDSVPYF